MRRGAKWRLLGVGTQGGALATQLASQAPDRGFQTAMLGTKTEIEAVPFPDRLQHRIPVPSSRSEFTPDEGAKQAATISTDVTKALAEPAADALLSTVGLGTGRYAGLLPRLIDGYSQIQSGEVVRYDDHDTWLEHAAHVVATVWPETNRSDEAHFAAYWGLTRLLTSPDGSQNAHMVLIATESADEPPSRSTYSRALNVFTIPDQAGTAGVIDINDFTRLPAKFGVHHFVPAFASGPASNITTIFDQAVAAPLAPIDPSSARVVYALVRAPTQAIEDGTITQQDINRPLYEWRQEALSPAVSVMTSLKPDPAATQTEILLLLGGVDLTPLLKEARPGFERTAAELRSTADVDDTIDTIETHLENYRDKIDESP